MLLPSKHSIFKPAESQHNRNHANMWTKILKIHCLWRHHACEHEYYNNLFFLKHTLRVDKNHLEPSVTFWHYHLYNELDFFGHNELLQC